MSYSISTTRTIAAIIETGGKQYHVERGMELEIELLDTPVGGRIKFTDLLNGKTVTAKVLEHGRGEKLDIFKYKAKKNVRKRQGHRQSFTKIVIEEIK